VILRWSRRAASQLFSAADYLESERPGTGERLYAAVDRVVAIIKDQPWVFPHDPHDPRPEVRRALVERYGYWIIYRVNGDAVEVLVLTFWSTRRRPGGWRRGRTGP
jgi:plasmid stabilization system protein ParE